MSYPISLSMFISLYSSFINSLIPSINYFPTFFIFLLFPHIFSSFLQQFSHYSDKAMSWRTEESEFDCWQGQDIFSYPEHPDQRWHPPILLFSRYRAAGQRLQLLKKSSYRPDKVPTASDIMQYLCYTACFHGTGTNLTFTFFSLALLFPSSTLLLL